MKKNWGVAGVAFCIVAILGCTTVVVHKNPSEHDRGIRFWRPKPYLFIGPIAPNSDNGQGGGAGTTTKKNSTQDMNKSVQGGPTLDAAHQLLSNKLDAISKQVTNESDNTGDLLMKVQMEIKYLPDYNEEYSIRLKPGLGVGSLNIQLQDGWNLTSVGQTSDQQTAQIIGSIASLVSAVKPGGAVAAPAAASKRSTQGVTSGTKDDTYIIDARRDVPLGFYEPIVANDPSGRKFMFAWRYVGFMPFAGGCPVNPCIQANLVDCSTDDLWGMIATKDSIKFQKLSEIKNGYLGFGNNKPNQHYYQAIPIKDAAILK